MRYELRISSQYTAIIDIIVSSIIVNLYSCLTVRSARINYNVNFNANWSLENSSRRCFPLRIFMRVWKYKIYYDDIAYCNNFYKTLRVYNIILCSYVDNIKYNIIIRIMLRLYSYLRVARGEDSRPSRQNARESPVVDCDGGRTKNSVSIHGVCLR